MDGTTPPQQTEPQISPEQLAQIRAQVVDEITGGKYDGDPTKAKEGFWNLTNYASQAMQALQAASQRDDPGAIAAARPEPLAPQTNPWDAVKSDYYGDPNILREAVRAEAQQIVAQAFQPIQQTVVARQNIQRDLPDYIANESTVLGWLEQNPAIYQMVYDVQNAGLPEQAMRLAYNEYYRAQNANASTPQKPPAMPGNPATPPNMPAPSNAGQTNWAELVMQANRSGNDREVLTKLFANYDPQLPAHLQG